MAETEEPQVLLPEDIVQAHNCPGGDAWLREQGYGEHLDKYLSSVAQGITWDPNDMTGVPPTPVASVLHGGMRKTADVELPEDSEEELPPYEEWSHDDLVAECEERKLSVEGTDEELAIRLMEYDEAEANIVPDYDLFKRSELQQICKQRGLPADGKNDELIARLQEDDAKRKA
jgi:hypothetical protein